MAEGSKFTAEHSDFFKETNVYVIMSNRVSYYK